MSLKFILNRNCDVLIEGFVMSELSTKSRDLPSQSPVKTDTKHNLADENIIIDNALMTNILSISAETGYSDIKDIFVYACSRGRVELAKKIFDKFNLTVENILPSNILDAFLCNCDIKIIDENTVADRLETIKWLNNKFNPIKDVKIRFLFIIGFAYACKSGNLEVAEWLLNELKITSEECGKYNFYFTHCYRDNEV